MLKSKLKPQNKWWYLLYLAVGLVIIYFGVVRPVQVRLEKARYEKAASELESLYTKITAKVGEPTQVKRDKSCAYASRAYGHGPLGCGVSVYLLYENINFEKSNQILENTYNYMGKHPSDYIFSTSRQKIEFTSFLDTQDYKKTTSKSGITNQTLSNSLNSVNIDGLSCSFAYVFPVTPDSFKGIMANYPTNLLIQLSCGGSTMAPYYPVTK